MSKKKATPADALVDALFALLNDLGKMTEYNAVMSEREAKFAAAALALHLRPAAHAAYQAGVTDGLAAAVALAGGTSERRVNNQHGEAAFVETLVEDQSL